MKWIILGFLAVVLLIGTVAVIAEADSLQTVYLPVILDQPDPTPTPDCGPNSIWLPEILECYPDAWGTKVTPTPFDWQIIDPPGFLPTSTPES